jgi:hypothetical protein
MQTRPRKKMNRRWPKQENEKYFSEGENVGTRIRPVRNIFSVKDQKDKGPLLSVKEVAKQIRAVSEGACFRTC